MNIKELISAITITLKNKYPETTIYKEKILQGFIKPCFFVTCLNSEQNKTAQLKYDREYLFNVRYHMESPERVELLIKGEELQEALQELKKNNEILIGKNLNYEIVDDVLQFFVSYKQRLIKIEKQGPLMNDLNIEGGVK
jgi:hypothetical protein